MQYCCWERMAICLGGIFILLVYGSSVGRLETSKRQASVRMAALDKHPDSDS